MPIEVTCRKCGRILILKEGMAGKTGKCPKCGNMIRVPRPLGIEESGGSAMSAHAQGIKVRGGVKKEEVPLPGSAIAGFTRSTALIKVRTSAQALTGLVLAVVGLALALLPSVPTQLDTPPVLGMGGGLIGALGAALAGWGFMNIRQQPIRFRGQAPAIAGLVVGAVAFVLGLAVFVGGGGSAGARGSVSAKTGALDVIVGKAARGECADQLKGAYKILKSYTDARRGQFPPFLTSLTPKYVDDMRPFCCPVAGDGLLQYRYTTGLTTESPAGTPLLYDLEGNHEGGRNVLLVTGKVVWMTEEQFQAKLEALKALSAPAQGEPAEGEPTEGEEE